MNSGREPTNDGGFHQSEHGLSLVRPFGNQFDDAFAGFDVQPMGLSQLRGEADRSFFQFGCFAKMERGAMAFAFQIKPFGLSELCELFDDLLIERLRGAANNGAIGLAAVRPVRARAGNRYITKVAGNIIQCAPH